MFFTGATMNKDSVSAATDQMSGTSSTGRSKSGDEIEQPTQYNNAFAGTTPELLADLENLEEGEEAKPEGRIENGKIEGPNLASDGNDPNSDWAWDWGIFKKVKKIWNPLSKNVQQCKISKTPGKPNKRCIKAKSGKDVTEDDEPSSNKDLFPYKKNTTKCIGNGRNAERDPKKSPACKLSAEPVIETLEDALECFQLKRKLKKIETSLEGVRKGQRSKEDHESDLKQFDKELQKLSFQYHPDRVGNRGSTDKELAVAQKLQAALNTTRTVLKVLGEAFLKDIGTEHTYKFYTNLSITSLGNEEDIKKHIHDVVFKISYLTEIKQRDIIAEIRDFLQEGRNCVEYYIDDKEKEFENSRISAMQHLKKCIRGFEKLDSEFASVQKECISEEKNNIAVHLKEMAKKSSDQLNDLKNVKEFVKKKFYSSDGRCRFYQPMTNQDVDDYFVLPFVCYMNVIVMCHSMFKNRKQCSWWPLLPESFSMNQESVSFREDDFLIVLNYPYCLASAYSGCQMFKKTIDEKMGEKSEDREAIREEFLEALKEAKVRLEERFSPENYSMQASNLFMDEYFECMKMAAYFKKQEEEIRRGIERIDAMAQEIEDRYDKVMKGREGESSRLQERLERCRLLEEQVSTFLNAD